MRTIYDCVNQSTAAVLGFRSLIQSLAERWQASMSQQRRDHRIVRTFEKPLPDGPSLNVVDQSQIPRVLWLIYALGRDCNLVNAWTYFESMVITETVSNCYWTELWLVLRKTSTIINVTLCPQSNDNHNSQLNRQSKFVPKFASSFIIHKTTNHKLRLVLRTSLTSSHSSGLAPAEDEKLIWLIRFVKVDSV